MCIRKDLDFFWNLMLQYKNIFCRWNLFIGSNHEATNHVEFLLGDYFTKRDFEKGKTQKCWNRAVQREIREGTAKEKTFFYRIKDVRTHSIWLDQGMLKEQRKVFCYPKENFAQNKIRLGNQRMLHRNIYDNWNQVLNHFFLSFIV